MDDDFDLRHLRERLQWTQEQMADYLGLDRSSVSRMENGQEPKGPTKRLLTELRRSFFRPGGDDGDGASPSSTEAA